MNNRKIFREISRLRTKDLLITKMDCTRQIALFRSLKLGLIGLLGIFVSQIAKTIYAAKVLSMMDYVSVPLALYCVTGFLICNQLEANFTAQKELICDLLSIRMNNSGKKS